MLIKNMIRKVKKSFGRYLSIFFIIFVGIGFLAGIQAASDDIRNSLQSYYESKKLMDIQIQSATGFEKEDLKQIQSLKNVKTAQLTSSIDLLDAKGKVVRVHEIQDEMNQFLLLKGTMPKDDTQILADATKYKVGDVLTIQSDVTGILKYETYTVSGIVKNPLYVSEGNGSTTLGDGTLNSFVFLKKDAFALPIDTQMTILMKHQKNDFFYTSAYKTDVKNLQDKIEEIATKEGKNWYVSDRQDLAGYKELEDSTFMIDKVAVVLPVFFILIVILMTSNTMARMIFEERLEMGTMLSLGYHFIPITFTYLGYVLSATIFASVLGFFAGSVTIPGIIYKTFQKFVMPPLVTSYYMEQFVLLLCAAVLLMSAVTIFFCALELRQIPAKLLRPVPPKKGQKIMLERIPFLWRRLNFTWKVTIRNMFRYKQRVFMMIVGVSGCMALLVTGFGLKQSINGVTKKQFQNIFTYDTMLTLKQEVSTLDEDFTKRLERYHLSKPLFINQSQIQVKKANKSFDIYMIVSQDKERFASYYHLKNIDNKKIEALPENGILLTKRVAQKLHVKAGDEISIINAQKVKRNVKIKAVVDNYIGNYAYFSKDMYKRTFDHEATYNLVLAKETTKNEKDIATQLKKESNVLNVTNQKDIMSQAKDGFSNLDGVIVLIVAVAVVLSFIVLYNLTSINLSERKREIATLKVLGFTESEANTYIYREAFLLSVISIVIGLFLGKIMHLFVIETIQGESTSYLTTIDLFSFLWPIFILLFVTILMQLVTYRKIQTIDMIDSLKSVE